VRIAFSGSHRVGKSTLVERVAEALPGYDTVDEPYHLLEEDGYECAEDPAAEDFLAQLERSIDALGEGERDVLFDRCPADILAYLEVCAADAFDADECGERAREAIESLDLIVFVPIEDRDRIALPAHEDRALRQAVHDRLHELIVENALGISVEILVVRGDLAVRAGQVLSRVRALSA
jgi:predicted ATPase